MKDILAQSLLANIMKWDASTLDHERFCIQLLADLKYDDYQKYSQGMRYVESLALWLKNFDLADREKMYNFIKKNLIYISEGQMRNLVESAYQFYIMPILLKNAKSVTLNDKERSVELNKEVFNSIVKSTLFLGLSDGSHVDVFRRSNPEISNEQISVYYDLSQERIDDMFNSTGRNELIGNSIFLLDDFSGSGISFIRKENGQWKGKIVKFLNRLENYGISFNNIDVHVLLYVSTKKAIDYINQKLIDYTNEKKFKKIWTANSIQEVCAINCDSEFSALLKKYYDKYSMKSIEDIHYRKGNIAEPFMGFDNCMLPLVLFHNTPNNAFPIIWFESEWKYRGLFPRVTRHKEAI